MIDWSLWMLHTALRESVNLWRNLCSSRWLKSKRDPVEQIKPIKLSNLKILPRWGLMKEKKIFFRRNYQYLSTANILVLATTKKWTFNNSLNSEQVWFQKKSKLLGNLKISVRHKLWQTLSWWMSLSYRNQSIDLQSMIATSVMKEFIS